MHVDVNYRILLVDDESLNIESLAHCLDDVGFQLFVADRGNEALNLSISEKPDVVLLNWRLPDMDGIQILKKLKKMPETEDIPVVILSASILSAENIYMAFKNGAIDVIRKPFDVVELCSRIKSLFVRAQNSKNHYERLSMIYKQEYEQEVLKNRILASEIEKSKDKVSFNSTRMIKYTEMNERMVADIKLLSDKLGNEGVAAVSDIINKYTLGAQKMTWTEFERLFDSVNNCFFAHLVSDFPSLTPHEKKLCAYYRMNFSTKEIATLTYSTHGAVRKARNRLRKKLELPQTVSLGTFLQHY